MTLAAIITIPLLAGFAAWYCERFSAQAPRWISVIALAVTLLLGMSLWPLAGNATAEHPWLMQWQLNWIPRFGITVFLAVDGLSLPLVILTALTGLVSVGVSWHEIRDRVGLFHANLLWTLAGVQGIFLSLDLFLFFFFWEVMLVPMYLLIHLWGHGDRVYASLKFFLFTQAGGLLMLVAILALVYLNRAGTGDFTFNYLELLGTQLDPRSALWILLGFFTAFAVKLPSFPLHPWLPDAHSEASTGGSVILAAILLKTGAYALIRFAIPLFPQAAVEIAPWAMGLGVISILYGAVLAFAQTDLKRLIACSSISHMGFVMLAVFAWNELALQGAVMTMLAHGFSSAALFMLAGAIYERVHTRDMANMGGLWRGMPAMGAMMLFWMAASVGLPGLSNFVGEFLVLVGSFRVNITMTVLAALGLVGAAIYALIMMQKTFYGEESGQSLVTSIGDLQVREWLILGTLVILTIWLGIYPQPVLETVAPALNHLMSIGVSS